jgi:hypothetical protein
MCNDFQKIVIFIVDNKQVVERSRNHLFMSEAETTCL